MTNEEKIDRMLTFYHGTKTLKELLLEMAKWKEQQMIKKSVEWLNEHLPFGEIDFNLRNTIIEDFKQSMKED